MTLAGKYVQVNTMRSRQLHDALADLAKAIREVEAIVAAMRAEHDPLASHIFVSRRHYRNIQDTKSGKGRGMSAHQAGKLRANSDFVAILTSGSD